MACFIGILEEFYQEVESHGKFPLFTLIKILRFCCAPSNLAVSCVFSIHRIQNVRTFYSYVFPILVFIESCIPNRPSTWNDS
jgi:hypothetical protein